MNRPLNDKGVSVIVGTLLLILITVIAAATLAVMVSQLQKDQMNRESQEQAVHDENIVISGMNLVNNETLWSTTYNIPNSQNWSSVSYNLMNLNTHDVYIAGIAINDNYGLNLNYTSLSGSYSMGSCNSLGMSGAFCNNEYANPNLDSNSSFLTIPAGESIKITIDLTGAPTPIGTDSQIDIKVLTSLTNIFEETYKLPNPVINYNTQTTSLGTIQRDNIVLDGSQSSSENASIVSWNWTFMNAANTSPMSGNCSDSNDLSPVSGLPIYFDSKIVHISPSSPGPFCANLTVTDSNGMIATTSQDQLIPADSQFTPAANLIAVFNTSYNPHVINVTVLDINGHPVNNAAVNYVVDVNQFGNLTLSNYVGTTTSQGMSSTNVTCGLGTVKVVSGQIPSSEVAVNANNGC